ncbi:MAG: CBS domain-containing protein, partial [Candidatus Komeilibacteria bacterium]|nr:CBS domain-containing protein [Candidatus Komeilibacteria bacterium]
LNTVSANLSKLHPADLANIIEDLSIGQGGHLVTSLDSQRAARVFEEINPQVQKILVKHLGAERVSEIFKSMPSDEMADIIKLLPKNEAKIVLRHLKNSAAEKIGKLLNYPSASAGGLMTLDYLTAQPDWTVKEAIDEIKKASPSMRSILYVYAVDKDNTFLGAISLRTLLVAEPDKKLNNLLKRISPLSTLTPYQNIDEIVKIMTKYNLYMAAVLDRKHKLLGVVAIDDIMSQLSPNA